VKKTDRTTIEELINAALSEAIRAGELAPVAVLTPAVERPRDPSHGDWASSVALRLARGLGKPPREIAEIIAGHTVGDSRIASVEVAGPGFINLRLSPDALHQSIREAREEGLDFGRVNVGQGRRVNVEFISANPTGPMHVGHGRWAALGNAICRLLEHVGWQVTREFYINDAGRQMEVFGHSVALCYRELLGESVVMPEDAYGGSYVRDIAQHILEDEGAVWMDADEELRDAHFKERGYVLMLERMQALCERIDVPFDVWFSERTLYERTEESNKTPVEEMLETLARDGFLYEKEGATWFRTTDYEDDKDRVLVKADGSYTYFAPDIAYHLDKFRRGHELLIDIWGADHHGYIPRMQAACASLGHEGALTIVLGQLVNLYRDGQPVRMSKRTGEMVTFEELIDEVGPDATKYLMVSRSTDQPIDFDIEAATRQDASNPVYYVQYAHARICSILRRANEEYAKRKTRGVESIERADLSVLIHPTELDLARAFARFQEVVEAAAHDLAPHRLTRYAEQLAASFTAFYHSCQVITDDEALTAARLYLCEATRNVLALTLGLLGVSAPERM
jgi:arginyl-tRNA synthetase